MIGIATQEQHNGGVSATKLKFWEISAVEASLNIRDSSFKW